MSDIRLVDVPVLGPAQCMFTEGNGPCLDFLRDFHPGHEGRIYISVAYAKEIGAAAGMGDPDASRSEIDRLRMLVDELTEENDRLTRFEEAAQYTMHHFGDRVRNKPGRKPNKEKVEV